MTDSKVWKLETFRTTAPRSISPALLLWLSIVALVDLAFSSHLAATLLSLVGLIHSIVGFLTHGGRRISAPGVYFFASGLFAFFPGAYLSSQDVGGAPPQLLPAINICLVGQLLSYYLFWKPTDRVAPAVSSEVEPGVLRWGMQAGLTLILVGTISVVVEPPLSVRGPLSVLGSAAAFSGVVLFAAASFRRVKILTPYAYVLVAAAFLFFATFVFSGFGRLNLGALGIAIAMTLTHRWRGRTVKIALLVCVTPVMLYLAASRVAFTASLNPNQKSDVTGLESVLSPVLRFSQLIDMDAHGQITYSYGSSFLTSLLVFVPRSIWPDKPVGFGAVLSHIFRPDLDGTGNSELALLYGEFLFNFGLFGLLLMIPIVAILLNWVDRIMIAVLAEPMKERRQLLAVASLIIAGAGMADLFWGGTFTYVSRAGPRVLVLLALYALFARRVRAVRQAHGHQDLGTERAASQPRVNP